MRKYNKKNKICFILTLAIGSLSIGSLFLAGASISFAAQTPRPTKISDADVAAAVISGPQSQQGLSGKETAELERQYRYTYREKTAILSPYLSGAGSETYEEAPEGGQTGQEKLYRYFGAATSLYEKGMLDEAIEILRYISEKNPDDKYVKNYLEKIINEKNAQKRQWNIAAESDSHLLKNQKTKNLMRDGIDYYKQKRFDMALLKFSDVLAIDPNNAQAKRYVDTLKEYYLKEVQIEDIVEKYEALQKPDSMVKEVPQNRTEDTAEKLLKEKESQIDNAAQKLLKQKEKGLSLTADKLLEKKEGEMAGIAERLLDEKEMESIVKEKKLGRFLDQAELGLTIEDIIAQKKEYERRSRLYLLGAGDGIQISVRDHPELSGKTIIRLDGEVVLPLVNDMVKVENFTLNEATAKITEALKRYVKDPFVTIAVDEYRSKIFYVIDELGCTPYPITRTNLTLRDALFTADWGDDRALGRVLVMKPHKLHPIIRKVDAFDIIYRGNLANNVRIEDGDVIYIPLTVAAKTTKTIADTIRPFAAIRTARDEWLYLKGDKKGYKDLFRYHQDATDNPWWIATPSSTSQIAVQQLRLR